MNNFDLFMHEVEVLMVKLFNTYELLEKRKFCYSCDSDLPLYPSEVHAIDAIATDNSIKMGELAEILGITSGAMSKLSRKLEKKGLIRRYHYLDNRKDVHFQLTPLGEKVYKGHLEYHNMTRKRFFDTYNGIVPKSAPEILEFLDHYHREMLLLLNNKDNKR